MRVLLLNNVPAPYFTPLFEKIAMDSGWELTVCYSSNWNQDVGWQAKATENAATHRVIILDQQSSWLRNAAGSSVAAAVSLFKYLIARRSDYLICYGYTLKPQVTALLWAMFFKLPFAVIGDANYFIDSTAGLKRMVKRFWLRQVTKRAAALIAIGTANRLFWESYGAREEQLFEAKFAVDNEFFGGAVARLESDAAELRNKLGFKREVIFLFVGRLVKRKNVDLIIEAARQFKNEQIVVVIAGSGDEAESLKALVGNHRQVIFAGNIPPSELPLYYAVADVLVLPAEREPWGLVVNEAMACGLAVIAHKDCGAAVDLVDEGNGVRLESFSVEEMARAMKRLASDEPLLRSMQQCSRERIQGWSIEAAARGIVRAVEASGVKR